MRLPQAATCVLVVAAGVPLGGCGWPCHDFQAWLYAVTDEDLVTDGAEPDWRDPPTVLSVETSGSAEFDGAELTLVYVDGSGFTLDGGDASLVEWEGDSAEAFEPSDATLAFTVTGPVELPTIEVPGDATEAELWNGWTLALTWDEPFGVCK